CLTSMRLYIFSLKLRGALRLKPRNSNRATRFSVPHLTAGAVFPGSTAVYHTTPRGLELVPPSA
uniref:Uncharacterized protein n=1 Tax=Aegilops tauschii subsp. strangulata TaxID=200361 RepID=A0A453EFR4_AEGTS